MIGDIQTLQEAITYLESIDINGSFQYDTAVITISINKYDYTDEYPYTVSILHRSRWIKLFESDSLHSGQLQWAINLISAYENGKLTEKEFDGWKLQTTTDMQCIYQWTTKDGDSIGIYAENGNEFSIQFPDSLYERTRTRIPSTTSEDGEMNLYKKERYDNLYRPLLEVTSFMETHPGSKLSEQIDLINTVFQEFVQIPGVSESLAIEVIENGNFTYVEFPVERIDLHHQLNAEEYIEEQIDS